MNVITRFPPSPTGYLHIGRARTALFNYLFAKKYDGKMVFRIEDTDRARSKKEYEENIVDCLKWLDIKYDSGPYRQSERGEVYAKYIQRLIDNGFAYLSDDIIDTNNITEGEDESLTNPKAKTEDKRHQVIRFKNPNKKIKFHDLIRGDIEFDTTDLKDFVIAKSLNEPLYHLTVVVDDYEMGITHVIRGEDGISNTPRQILIQEAIGAPRPIYAHLPLILAPDKTKLSGRHGAVAVTDYRELGYLPEAIINFLALLGWNPGTEQEIFSINELINAFDINKVNKSGAVFNIEKLNWYNKQYIQKLRDTDFISYASTFIPEWLNKDSDTFKKLFPLLKDKITIFSDIKTLLDGGELAFIKEIKPYDKQMLLWKKTPDPALAKKHLIFVLETLQKLDHDSFTAEKIKSSIWSYVEANGKGDVLWPMRVAITGQERSPDPFISAMVVGREETINRISKAIELL
jgi:glutamyl-tRNA synthetase